MKNTILIISLVLNLILIVAIVGVTRYSRRTAFKTIADMTTAEIQQNEHILIELDSEDPKRIEAVKEFMRKGIKEGKVVAAQFESAANW